MSSQQNNTEPKFKVGQTVIYIGTTVAGLINNDPYKIVSFKQTCCGWVYDLGVAFPGNLKRVMCLDHNNDLTHVYKNVLFVIERYLREPEKDTFAETICTKIEESFKIKPVTIDPIYILPKELQPCPQ